MKIASEQSKTYGNPEARKFVVIFDMENFSMKQYVYRPAAELVINIFRTYSLNYPEILKYCYIINGELFCPHEKTKSVGLLPAPKIFSFAFGIVKKFLDEYTLSKIKIYKNNQKKWLPVILERISPDHLPACYGGYLTDIDGNKKCFNKISWGGKLWYTTVVLVFSRRRQVCPCCASMFDNFR